MILYQFETRLIDMPNMLVQVSRCSRKLFFKRFSARLHHITHYYTNWYAKLANYTNFRGHFFFPSFMFCVFLLCVAKRRFAIFRVMLKLARNIWYLLEQSLRIYLVITKSSLASLLFQGRLINEHGSVNGLLAFAIEEENERGMGTST